MAAQEAEVLVQMLARLKIPWTVITTRVDQCNAIGIGLLHPSHEQLISNTSEVEDTLDVAGETGEGAGAGRQAGRQAGSVVRGAGPGIEGHSAASWPRRRLAVIGRPDEIGRPRPAVIEQPERVQSALIIDPIRRVREP